MALLDQQGFRNFFQYFKGEPQQDEAVEMLRQALPSSLLEDDAKWVQKYRQTPPAPVYKDSAIPQQGLNLIKKFEGCVLHPYLDGVGVATIGYGSTFYENGSKVKMTDPDITQERADSLFTSVVEKDFWEVIKKTIPFWSDMNDNQRSALLSFSFNLGAHFFGANGFSTISSCLREKRWSDVPDALYLYRMPGTNVEAGLARRRKAEGDLWLK